MKVSKLHIFHFWVTVYKQTIWNMVVEMTLVETFMAKCPLLDIVSTLSLQCLYTSNWDI